MRIPKTDGNSLYTVCDTIEDRVILTDVPRSEVEKALKCSSRTIYACVSGQTKLVKRRYFIVQKKTIEKKDLRLPPKLLEQWRYLHERYKTV